MNVPTYVTVYLNNRPVKVTMPFDPNLIGIRESIRDFDAFIDAASADMTESWMTFVKGYIHQSIKSQLKAAINKAEQSWRQS